MFASADSFVRNAAPLAVAAQQPNPIASIPTSLFPVGTSRWQAYVGPSWLLSRDQGVATVRRTADRIEIETPHGNASIAPAAGGQVTVSLPDGSSYTGTITNTRNGAVFRTNDGKTVTFTRNGNRVDISLSGFGFATDRIGVYLRAK